MEQKYIDLHQRVNELRNKEAYDFESWMNSLRTRVYKKLPELLSISRPTISSIRGGRQNAGIETIKRMAVISQTPAMELVSRLRLFHISLDDSDELKQFDKELQKLLNDDNQPENHNDEKPAATT